MRLSQTSEYALRAVLHMAEVAQGRAVPANEMADVLDVPRNYLSKVLDHLRQRGILTATRGPGGGFRLAHDATEITLADVIEPHDPVSVERACLLGRPQCLDTNPCAAHEQWRAVGATLTRFFHETTIAALMTQEQDEPHP